MRRAREEDAVIVLEAHLRQDALFFLRRNIRIRLVELRVARHDDELGRSAEALDVVSINRRLHRELLDRADHVVEQAVEVLVLLDALVADAAVDHHDGDVELPRGLQEIRPELRLDGQVHARTDALQHMAREPWQVEREIDDGIRVFDDAVCHLVAARRHDGHENRARREFTAELLDERARRDDFADGRRVHPDAVLIRHFVERVRREEPETLLDALDESLLAHRADHEHRNDEHADDDGRDVVQ